MVRFVESFIDKGLVYIVTKQAKEGNLLYYMKKHGIKIFSESQAKSIVRQLLGAIGQMHKQGLVHRDIKQLNILVDSVSEDSDDEDFIHVKLCDFGTSVDLNQVRVLPEAAGTRNFMAPEVY